MRFAPPHAAAATFQDPIRIADWVELNLLLGEELTVSAIEVTDELASDPPDDSDASERRFSDSDGSSTGYWQSAEEHAERALLELSQRAAWLGARYPLSIEDEVVTINDLADGRDVYRFLVSLRARHLYPSALGDDGNVAGLIFEELVKHAVGAYIGAEQSNQIRFGVAGGHRGDDLPGDVADAIEALRAKLHEDAGSVPHSADGDFRADAIAWKPFADNRPGQLVMLAQATISEGDWIRKEPANRWTDRMPLDSRLINFLARPVTLVAFPETLSLTRGDRIRGLIPTFCSIPLDRLRILSVIRDDQIPIGLLSKMNGWAAELRDKIP